MTTFLTLTLLVFISFIIQCTLAEEPYWNKMFPLNLDAVDGYFDKENPSAAYNTNIEASFAVIVWSSRGDGDTVPSKLMARRVWNTPYHWAAWIDNEDYYWEEQTLFTSPSPSVKKFESSIACDNNSTWVVVFSSDDDVRIVRSTDNAQTWSSATSIFVVDTPVDQSPVVLFDARTSTWYVAWLSGKTVGDTGLDLDVALTTSTDGGVTWSSLVWVNPTASGDSTNEANVRLTYGSAGCLNVFYLSTSAQGLTGGTDGDIFVRTTCDLGVTFQDVKLVDDNDDNEVSFDATASLDGVNVVVVYRTLVQQAEMRQVRVSESHNGAVSFSASVTIHSVVIIDEPETPPSVRTDSRGLFICAFGSRQQFSRTSDWLNDWMPFTERLIDVGTDVDIYYSIASTLPDGIPGTGWSVPHVADEYNAAQLGRGDTDQPVLFHNGAEMWSMVASSTLSSVVGRTAIYYGTDRDIFFMYFEEMSGEMCAGNNGPGLASYCSQALQSRINELPADSADEVSMKIAGHWWMGGETPQEAAAASIRINQGRKIKLEQTTKGSRVELSLWGNHQCYFPMFIIEDSTSSLRFDVLDQAVYEIESGYLVLNLGNSPDVYFQVDALFDGRYHKCGTSGDVHLHIQCPLGFRPPEPTDPITYWPRYCVPCPAGRECGDDTQFTQSSSPSVTCPAGRYCPVGTFNSNFTKCGNLQYFPVNVEGMTSLQDCQANGLDCEFGFWCPPGTVENVSYVKVLFDVPSVVTASSVKFGTLTLDETLVYPASKAFAFDIKRNMAVLPASNPQPFPNMCMVPTKGTCDDDSLCMDGLGQCSWNACETMFPIKTGTGYGCYGSPITVEYNQTQPVWIELRFNDDYSDDYTIGFQNESAVLKIDIHSLKEGVSISDILTHSVDLNFYSLWDTYPHLVPVMQPLKVSVTRAVTTVIFNPAEQVSLKSRFDAANFSFNATMFNIGCDDSLTWTAQMWDCSTNPADPFTLNISQYPVNWTSTVSPYNSGSIAVGVTDPAIIMMRIFPLQVDVMQAKQVLGFLEYKACLRVEFVMASDTTKVLKKDLAVSLATFRECPKGSYSISGTSENGPCTPCEAGTYADVQGLTVCRSCPESFPRSLVGTTALKDCKAAPGYFRDSDGSSGQCSKLGSGVSCLSEGVTLETVELLPGFWRSNNKSKSVLRCPNRVYCVGGQHHGSSNNASSSSRRALAQSQLDGSYCLVHHTGPYCQVCEPGYVKRGLAPCGFCDENAYKTDQQRLFWTILAGAVIIILAFLLTQRQRLKSFAKRRAGSIVALGRQLNARGSIVNSLMHGAATDQQQQQQHPRPGDVEEQQQNKLPARPVSSRQEFARSVSRRLRPISHKIDKRVNFLWTFVVSIEASTTLRILVSLFQVIGGISKNFNDIYPEIFTTIAAAFNALSSEIFYNIDFACVVHTNHYLSLILGMLAPALATLLIVLVHLVFERRLRLHRRFQDIARLRSGTFSVFLVLLFLIYPSVSATILGSFVCRTFDDGSRWLRRDVTIDCDAEGRTGWLALASFGIAIYVIGVPVCYLVSLIRVRKEINPPDVKQIPDRTKFASVLFLTEIYKRQYWYWEVFELIRKLVQTSLIIFFLDGSVMQMIVMIAVSMIVVQTINEVKPYKNEAANRLASVAQWEILIVSFIGLLLKVDLSVLDSTFAYNKHELLTGVLVAVCFMAPVFAVFQSRKLVYRVLIVQRCGFRRQPRTSKSDDDSDYYSSSSGRRAMSNEGIVIAHIATPTGGVMENPVFAAELTHGKNSDSSSDSGSAGDANKKVSFAVMPDVLGEEKRDDR